MKPIALLKLTGLFLVVKLVQLLILLMIPARFDLSSGLVLSHPDVIRHQEASRLLVHPALHTLTANLLTWDAVYFANFFTNGLKYEHEFVFSPLWWRLVKALPLFFPSMALNFFDQFLTATAIAIVAHYLACIALYHLTSVVFASNTLAARASTLNLALKAAMVYALSPAGIFLTAPYAESLCALTSFVALYLREISFNPKALSSSVLRSHPLSTLAYLLSGTMVALAFGLRSNALLLGYFYLYDLVQFGASGNRRGVLMALIAGSQLFFAVVYAGFVPYALLCPQRGEWCLSAVPSLFAYAQKRYWNNGFLTYWTLNNLPNFIFALPTALLMLAAARHFTFTYPCRNVYAQGTVAHLLLVMMFGFSNVQILTRVGSFLPVMYWYIADKLALSQQAGTVDTITKLSVGYCVVWGVAQTALFGAFLPPA